MARQSKPCIGGHLLAVLGVSGHGGSLEKRAAGITPLMRLGRLGRGLMLFPRAMRLAATGSREQARQAFRNAQIEEIGSLLGPRMSIGEFLEENPYNGFTVYKGHIARPFRHEGRGARQDLIFMSGRPTVALDYHARPTGRSSDTDGIPMLATGDIRASRAFRDGDRFFSPQSASVHLEDQIRAARTGRGVQSYYRTGVHHSSDSPDFEIPIPRSELPGVFSRYYAVEPTENIGFVPFGQFAEAHLDPSTFSKLPFSFRRISDPDRFSFMSEGLGKVPLTINPNHWNSLFSGNFYAKTYSPGASSASGGFPIPTFSISRMTPSNVRRALGDLNKAIFARQNGSYWGGSAEARIMAEAMARAYRRLSNGTGVLTPTFGDAVWSELAGMNIPWVHRQRVEDMFETIYGHIGRMPNGHALRR